MNSVNILYLFSVLCLLVAPSFTAPQSGSPAVDRNLADDSKNEVTSDLSKDVETFKPVNSQGGQPSVGSGKPVSPAVPVSPASPSSPASPASPDAPQTPEFAGGSSGIITKIGIEGPFICHNVTCPAETEVCKFNSTFNADGKTQKVQIRCFDKNDKVLLTENKVEPIDTQSFFNFDRFFSSVTDRMNSFFNNMNSFFRF